MRTLGIIAEYNPFHTGHEYHLRRAKELSGADFAVVVMSPDFVQRGEPAVFDKYTRTQMALQNGADLVLELPVCYATGSAEYFARGAVCLLERLHVIHALCFGAESDDTRLFFRSAGTLLSEPEPYVRELRRGLKEGKTFPRARSEALTEYLSRELSFCTRTRLHDFLLAPNNILGIEYCRALLRTGSPIRALPIRREGSLHDSASLDGSCCSASALRKGIREGKPRQTMLRYVPENCRRLFEEAQSRPVFADRFMICLYDRLLSMESYDHFLDIGPALSDRIRRLRFTCIGKTFDETVALLKTKQMTEAHIRRALLHMILGIRQDTTEGFLENGTVFYARVLGFRRDAAPLLHEIRQKSSIPLIVKNARARQNIPEPGRQMWEQDIFASHLYRAAEAARQGKAFCSEYQRSPLVLPAKD